MPPVLRDEVGHQDQEDLIQNNEPGRGPDPGFTPFTKTVSRRSKRVRFLHKRVRFLHPSRLFHHRGPGEVPAERRPSEARARQMFRMSDEWKLGLRICCAIKSRCDLCIPVNNVNTPF